MSQLSRRESHREIIDIRDSFHLPFLLLPSFHPLHPSSVFLHILLLPSSVAVHTFPVEADHTSVDHRNPVVDDTSVADRLHHPNSIYP